MTEQDFLHRMDNADDWRPHVLALADWLEERGDPRAKGWRWLVRLNKRPFPPEKVALWWWIRAHRGSAYVHGLPDCAFDLLPGIQSDLDVRYYETLSDALANAAQAAAKWLETEASNPAGL